MEDTLKSQPLTGQAAQAEQGEVTFKLKASLAVYLISAAALFARQTYAVEQQKPSISSGQLWMDHRSYAIGAVIASASFMEATINELYLQAIDKNEDTYGAHVRLAEMMGRVWETIERNSVLAKCQVALALAEKPAFLKGEAIYQDMQALIKLRNALVHYKPEWDTEPDVNRTLEKALSQRFTHNPFESNTKPFFPHRCLGHGCAAWSVTTAIGFYQEFLKRVGLPPWKISNPAGLAVK